MLVLLIWKHSHYLQRCQRSNIFIALSFAAAASVKGESPGVRILRLPSGFN